MHTYSIGSDKREKVVMWKVVLSIIAVIAVSCLLPPAKSLLSGALHMDERWFDVASGIFSLLVPLSIYGIISWAYNNWVWKYLVKWHHVPDLNGKWDLELSSSVKDHQSRGKVSIKQSWNRIMVSIAFESGSKSHSGMAAVVEDGLNTYLLYDYSVCRGNSTYQGFNKLQYDNEKNVLEGQYFTSKAFSNQELNRFADCTKWDMLREGIGSKGTLRLKR